MDNRLFEQGDEYLKRASELAEESGDGNLIARVLTGMSRLNRERGDLDRARAICEKAADIVTRTGATTEAHLALETARVHKELGNREEALFYARTALDIFSRVGMQKEVAGCEVLLGSLEDGSE